MNLDKYIYLTLIQTAHLSKNLMFYLNTNIFIAKTNSYQKQHLTELKLHHPYAL